MSTGRDWFERNASRFTGQLSFDEALFRHIWYRIGGPARIFCVPRSLEDLRWIQEGLHATGLPVFVLGMGSNLLISDEGFEGIVVKTGKLNLELGSEAPDPQTGRVRIRAGASVAISSFLRKACLEGWGGLEFLTGIPGSIGGAVFMNAGTHLGESCERLRAVEYVDLGAPQSERARVEGTALSYQYRKNLFLPPGGIVWAAEWEAKSEPPAHVKEIVDQTLARRKATQPIDLPSCGSVFKNPRASGLSAWQVIDQLGLRGYRIGGAEFSPKHCNFIVNVGEARSGDVYALIQLAKTKAKEQLGIELEEEVRYLGHLSSSRV